MIFKRTSSMFAVIVALVIVGVTQTMSAPASGARSLQAPKNLRLHTGTAATLFWSLSGAVPVGYRIYRSAGVGGAYRLIGETTDTNLLQFQDAAQFIPGVTYAYEVSSFNRQSVSPRSKAVYLFNSSVLPTATSVPVFTLPTWTPPQ